MCPTRVLPYLSGLSTSSFGLIEAAQVAVKREESDADGGRDDIEAGLSVSNFDGFERNARGLAFRDNSDATCLQARASAE